MSNRFDDRRPTALEEQAHAEASQHFAEHLKQFPASREAVERLERDIAKIALAANMAASKPTPKENIIQVDDGEQWHKSVDLMEDICLCHRPISCGAEYAVVEHFPARGTNEILNRGWNAGRGIESVCTRAKADVAGLDGGHDRAGEGIFGRRNIPART